MTPARFQTIEQIYRDALAQQPDQISAFLDNACEGDAALRHKVEALLSSRQQADGFIESSAVSLAAKLIQNGHGQSLVDEVERRVRQQPRFRVALTGVWLSKDVPPDVRARLARLGAADLHARPPQQS